MVERNQNSNGVYGNPDNPISILHCMPCAADIHSYILFRENKAKGYGVVLRCKSQDIDIAISKYNIRVERNIFADGGTIVIYWVQNSIISVTDNVCNTDFVLKEDNNKDLTLALIGNITNPNVKID